MRVVDIINLSTSADTLLRDRALALRAAGIDNRIVCIDGPRVAVLRGLGIPVHTVHLPRALDPFRLLLSFFEIVSYLRRDRVDLVHTHCSVPGVVGRLAAWLAGVPVIVHTVHGFPFHERTPRFQRWVYVNVERLCGRATRLLLTQNRSDLALAERYGIGSLGHRRYIGNGVDLVRFHPRVRRNGERGVVNLACVARLEPIKNHRLLFEAASLLEQRGLPFRLRLVGDGARRSEYQDLCHSLGISQRVEFLGYRADVLEVLADTDIAVLTSIKEGIPRAVLEAMAMGIPVVATRVTGTRETVEDGETGFLVELGDPAGLADVLAMLITDPALRGRLGASGRSRVEQRFDEREIVTSLESLYRALVPDGAPEPREETAGIVGDPLEAHRDR